MAKSSSNVKNNTLKNLVLVGNFKELLKNKSLDNNQIKALKNANDLKQNMLTFYHGEAYLFVIISKEKCDYLELEALRKLGAKCCQIVNEKKLDNITVDGNSKDECFAVYEGISLANYQFLKYFSDSKSKKNTLMKIDLECPSVKPSELNLLSISIEATYKARTLVNEPQSFLNALQLSEEFKKLGKEAGFSVEVWNEAKIESQKMGGLLAVNKGSITPPTFNIMEYKPKNAKNKKPYVLVGKGVVYDTGGLSLKPTPMSMDYMKCDMAGSAVVAATMYAVTKAKLPLYVVGLVPATDNWIGEESYAPGDVITMYNGTTVEVLNTDAEGRLILADALHYAKKLNPELVCDFATLTGAAVRAIGPYASAFFGTANDDVKQKVFESSYAVFERLVEFPLWDDYAAELKSSIADMTNLGKGEGGQISAAKFLQHFTDYPWMHFDIAGPAFIHGNDGYKTAGGTGVGFRLMFDFLTKIAFK